MEEEGKIYEKKVQCFYGCLTDVVVTSSLNKSQKSAGLREVIFSYGVISENLFFQKKD